jgi:hypothetical protein
MTKVRKVRTLTQSTAGAIAATVDPRHVRFADRRSAILYVLPSPCRDHCRRLFKRRFREMTKLDEDIVEEALTACGVNLLDVVLRPLTKKQQATFCAAVTSIIAADAAKLTPLEDVGEPECSDSDEPEPEPLEPLPRAPSPSPPTFSSPPLTVATPAQTQLASFLHTRKCMYMAPLFGSDSCTASEYDTVVRSLVLDACARCNSPHAIVVLLQRSRDVRPVQTSMSFLEFDDAVSRFIDDVAVKSLSVDGVK